MYNYIISVWIIKMTAYTIQRNAEARIFKNDKSKYFNYNRSKSSR